MAGGLYLALQSSRVQTFLTREIASRLSKTLNAEISVGRVDITFFKKVILEDVIIGDQQGDTLFSTHSLTAEIEYLNFREKTLSIRKLNFGESRIEVRKDTTGEFNFRFLLEALANPEREPGEWQFFGNHFNFSGAGVTYQDLSQRPPATFFLDDLSFTISGFSMVGDSLDFKIDQLTLKHGENLEIQKFNTDFHLARDTLLLTNFNLETGRSAITESEFRFELPEREESLTEAMQLRGVFSHSRISLSDLAQVFPSLEGMNQVVDCSGQIHGTINDLKGRDLVLNTGNNTSAILDFYINDLTDPEAMYLFLDLKRSQTTFSDLSRIRLPSASGMNYLRFPEAFYDSGIITYEGNFTGFLTDFVAFGTLSSEMGKISTDLSMVPEKEGRIVYSGKVATEHFELGNLFKVSSLDKITFNGSVDGYFDRKNNSIAGAFDGEIAEIGINEYTYTNIEIDGIMDNKMFDGLIIIDDPNLRFDFLGKVNLNPDVPNFDFRMDLKKALPGKLNLSDNYPSAEMSFTMNADFSGNKIDNLIGTINVENGLYKNRNGDLSLKGMELQSITTETANYLSFSSDFFDVKINGSYQFKDILNAFKKSFARYIPAIPYQEKPLALNNKFGYQIDVKNLDELMTVFAPGYQIETPFLIYGRLDAEQSVFEMKGNIPGFKSQSILVRNISIGNNPENGVYASDFKLGEVHLRNGMKLENMTIHSTLSGNEILNVIEWGKPVDPSYSGTIKTRAIFSKRDNTRWPHIEVEGMPTDIFIGDSLWQIAPFSASIDSTAITLHDFNFYNGDQRLEMEGKISEDGNDILSIDLFNINLWNTESYLNREIPLGGTVNGSSMVQDFYGERLFHSNLNIADFHFKNQKIGDILIKNEWDDPEKAFNSQFRIMGENHQTLYASGSFNTKNNEIAYSAEVDHLPLVILETVIRKTISDFKGEASGNLKIHGTPENILLDGTLMGENAGLTVDYTQVSYSFNDSVSFMGDTILFDQINIRDPSGNWGVFNGTIVHTNFQDMIYDLTLNSPKILAIDTRPEDNQQFFGKVVANGRLFITGRGRQVNLTGSATTLSGTNVNISMESESEIERYDFIQFVSVREEDQEEALTFKNNTDGGVNLNLTIRATPEAKARLIYNSQIGDVIKGEGEGVLEFGMDKEGNITLSGTYTLTRGEYLFTLQNVINKRFSIEQGGSIEWSGDPYNAIIDLNAVYKLKASLYDLLVNSYENIYQSQRISVECKILLSGDLSNPDIDFEIDFPTVEDRLIDEIQQFFNTPEDMNKQILSLIVLGKFYTPEYLRGTYEAQNPNVIGTTASELFSNQLSNWLSQISNNVDIGLNYRPGNQITDDEIELALSTQLFNDRVIINGNIGNNNNPNSMNNNELVGDFEVNVKLIPTGKIQLKAYNRSNNNLIYETAPYTQGVGFSFTEDYNRFNDLLKKMKNLFTGKEKRSAQRQD